MRDDLTEFLDEIVREGAARRRAEVDALRAEGLEPASRAGQVCAGMHLFSFTLGPGADDDVEVRLSFEDDENRRVEVWGRSWPRSGAVVDPASLLVALTDAWPGIAGERCAVAAARDGAVLSPPGLPTLEISGHGDETVVRSGTRSRVFGRERVIVEQTLMALADLLAADLGPEHPASLAWSPLRAATDLPPMEVDGYDEDFVPADTLDAQTTWSASKLGRDRADYVRTAIDVHARQVLQGMTGLDVPDLHEHAPDHVSTGPSPEDLAARVAAAAASMNVTPQAFVENAVASRNADAFQDVFYSSGRSEGPAP